MTSWGSAPLLRGGEDATDGAVVPRTRRTSSTDRTWATIASPLPPRSMSVQVDVSDADGQDEFGAPGAGGRSESTASALPGEKPDIRVTLALSAAVVILGMADRIAYKTMLVPLERYPYFISQVSSVVYCFIYFPILWFEARRHNLSLLAPLKRFWYFFLATGFLDGLGDTLGLVSARHLSGTLLTLLPKVIIPMTMIASYFILKVTYGGRQIGAAATVLIGVGIALIPVLRDSQPDQHDSAAVQVFSTLLYLASVAPSAVSFVLKELIFRRDPKLNVFFVSFYGSVFELLATLLFLPLSAIPDFGHVPLKDLPEYFVEGIQCWAGSSIAPGAGPGDACYGDPWAPLVYHVLNISWNITLIFLLARAGATMMFIANTLKFPIANLAFGFRFSSLLPAEPEAFSVYNILGLCVELTGVSFYQYFTHKRHKQDEEKAEGFKRRRSRSITANPSLKRLLLEAEATPTRPRRGSGTRRSSSKGSLSFAE